MTVARSFPLLRYNPDTVGDPGQLLAPPYDVVDEDDKRRLSELSEHQSALIECPADGDVAGAGRRFRNWIDQDVLEETGPGLAVIQQRYVGPDGVRRTRIGVACEVQLSQYGDGEVLPHERTMDGPKRERLELMRTAGANISPVFMVYHDPERPLHDLLASITDDEPDFTASDAEGTQAAVWFVSDLAICEAFESAVRPHPLLIADGHHRYESALAYQQQARERAPLSVVGGADLPERPGSDSSGSNGVLAVVANSADEGMCVFPTHRVLRGVDPRALDEFVIGSGAFDVSEQRSAHAALDALDELDAPGFVVCDSRGARLFASNDPLDLQIAAPNTSDAYRSLDVVALHALVLDGGCMLSSAATSVHFTPSEEEAAALATEEGVMSFLLRGVDVERVHEVARAGDVLPKKSTYFYPKVPTGVVFRQLAPTV